MTEIPTMSKSKRPSFFDAAGVDQLVTMMLEMMTETWVVKERLFALEKALEEAGVSVKDKVENCSFNDDEVAELEQQRRKFVTSIMRALEANFVDRGHLQTEIDEETDDMKSASG